MHGRTRSLPLLSGHASTSRCKFNSSPIPPGERAIGRPCGGDPTLNRRRCGQARSSAWARLTGVADRRRRRRFWLSASPRGKSATGGSGTDRECRNAMNCVQVLRRTTPSPSDSEQRNRSTGLGNGDGRSALLGPGQDLEVQQDNRLVGGIARRVRHVTRFKKTVSGMVEQRFFPEQRTLVLPA